LGHPIKTRDRHPTPPLISFASTLPLQGRVRKRRCIAPLIPINAPMVRPAISLRGTKLTEPRSTTRQGRFSMAGGIFEGLKVLDCASFIAAPAAATVLADFGAEVIKIEPPGSGDPYRHLPKLPGYPISPHNYAWLLESRNKRSLALDLAKAEARAVLYRLASEADVFITNYPPAVRKRLGIAYDDIKPLNRRLIYASFTGYGEKGEEADKPGFDSNAYWARSGLMDLVRADENTTPARSVPGMGDHPCAMAFYGAIVTALYKRERTGEGSHVSSNLMANGIWAAGVLAQAKLCGAKFQARRPRERALNAVTNHYRCKDGRWLILSLLNEERQWPAL